MRNPNSIGNARKYKVNHNFFDIIDTENKAYWVGFLSADGNITDVSQNCKQISITLK